MAVREKGILTKVQSSRGFSFAYFLQTHINKRILDAALSGHNLKITGICNLRKGIKPLL